MICTSCGSHFFKDQYTSKGQCFNCSDVLLDDDDISDDVFEVMNPTGKTKAYIEDADNAS